MALFQQSVLKKYLHDQSLQSAVEPAWQKFQAHFHNPVIQQKILDAKKEEYQEGFVRDLFVTIFDYTLKPQPNFNFVLERKTADDTTKSDGAIIREEQVIAVFHKIPMIGWTRPNGCAYWICLGYKE